MADSYATSSGSTTSTLPQSKANNALDSSREIPTLKILAELIAGEICADEAAEQLQLLGAPSWFIRSVHSIEQQFADPDPDYCGPMAEVCGKVLGDV